MPTTLPLPAPPRMTLRQTARYAWLLMLERHLVRRMERASRRQGRIGVNRGGGRLLHLTRRWLACHAAIAALLDAPEPDQVAEVRAMLSGRPRPDSRPRGKGEGIDGDPAIRRYGIPATMGGGIARPLSTGEP